jgi:hypothetical protein
LTNREDRWGCNPGEEGTSMLRVVTDDEGRAEMRSGLDEIVLKGAQRMLAAALEAEVDAYIAGLAEQLDEDGRRLVVRNGHAEPRTITTAAGRIEVQAPRVNDRRVDDHTGERCRFRSSILPPWCRKSPKVAEVLPLMYLHGMSTLDFAPALSSFFGSAAGLSASDTAHPSVARRGQGLRCSAPRRPRLRLHLGRRRALQRPAGRGPAVRPGHRGCPWRRDQGVGGHHRRLPGVERVLGRPAT